MSVLVLFFVPMPSWSPTSESRLLLLTMLLTTLSTPSQPRAGFAAGCVFHDDSSPRSLRPVLLLQYIYHIWDNILDICTYWESSSSHRSAAYSLYIYYIILYIILYIYRPERVGGANRACTEQYPAAYTSSLRPHTLGAEGPIH